MTAIEQAKQNIARAEELAQAVKDGKAVEFEVAGKWHLSSLHEAADFFEEFDGDGSGYRIIEPKRRRPWTREEAERHVGWVLVSPGLKVACITWMDDERLYWNHGPNPSLSEACKNNWHVHLPGQPDDLKPCSVEE